MAKSGNTMWNGNYGDEEKKRRDSYDRAGERKTATRLDPLPNVPSPPIVPKEWPPHPLNPKDH